VIGLRVLSELAQWLVLIGGFGQAAKRASAVPQTKWEPKVAGQLAVLQQLRGMETGKAIEDTMEFAASLTERQQQPKW
jgi:hypothetical protein